MKTKFNAAIVSAVFTLAGTLSAQTPALYVPGGVATGIGSSANGNVGVGVSSPAEKLDVSGRVKASADIYTSGEGATRVGFLNAGGASAPDTYFGIYYDSTNNIGVIQGLSGGVDWRGVSLVPRGGNVGIGTFNPGSYKLAVNGTIHAKEVVVDLVGWSDYVFAPDYRLAPLSEVEAQIKAEGHLPGIPSAKDIAERGVSMGEMQSKLLAKIEELTLHQIEQEKAIQRLSEENKQLRADISNSNQP